MKFSTGTFWPCSIQGHFEFIQCACNFFENTISKKHYRYFSYKSQPKLIKLLLNLIFLTVLTKVRVGFLKVEF